MKGSRAICSLRNSLPVRQALPLRHVRYATTALRMPAMSPTMTEGGIAGWTKNEGEIFTAGDVLLEIETDKATIDVEAQDDGVMGKIIAEAGSSKIPVGQVIAMLAEEGDDLASIQVPANLGPEESSGAKPEPRSGPEAQAKEEKPAPKKERKEEEKAESSSGSGEGEATEQETAGGRHKEIRHPKPLFPSVSRLLLESSLSTEQISKLKGTGRNGMLTKGDVLFAMGQIKNAYGSAEKINLDIMGSSGHRASESKTTSPAKKEPPLDGPGLRRLILSGMSRATEPAKPIVQHVPTPLPLSSDAEFDAMLAPYASLLPELKPAVVIPSAEMLAEMESKGLGRRRDEWAGLF